MKLFITQLALFVVFMILVLTYRDYAWIPLVLMTVPVILLSALVYNIPRLGLLTAKIEAGRELFIVFYEDKHKIDTYIVTERNIYLRVLHVQRRRSGYRHWVTAHNQ